MAKTKSVSFYFVPTGGSKIFTCGKGKWEDNKSVEHCFYFIVNIPLLKKFFRLSHWGLYGDIKIKTYYA